MSQRRTGSTRSVGGALVALSGLLLLVDLLGAGRPPVLSLGSAVALAPGSCVLALGLGGGSIVGASRVGRVAVLIFGVGPLAYLLPLESTPWPVLPGMVLLTLITIAAVVAAVTVARSAVLKGIARWMLLVSAADALVTLAVSSSLLGSFPLGYLDWRLELIRPLALLIWGSAIVLHGRSSAVRDRGAAFNAAWKRSTDVGGAAPEVALEGDSHR